MRDPFPMCLCLFFPNTEPTQTKVPLYGHHISSRKAQAMKLAKDRMKHLARPGPINNRDPAPALDKLEPEIVSDLEITKTIESCHNLGSKIG